MWGDSSEEFHLTEFRTAWGRKLASQTLEFGQ